jgi:hypothetical protein
LPQGYLTGLGQVASLFKGAAGVQSTAAFFESVKEAGLARILGHDGDVETLSHELSERIRIGAIAIDDPALRAHVRQSLADALTINNPKWLTR